MNKRLIVIGAAILVALNSAWIFEGTSNNCAALESLAMRKTMTNNNEKGVGAGMAVALMKMSNGTFAAAMAAEKAPGIPTSLSCNLVYWGGLNAPPQPK